ncbi:MAG TPA: ABC transporter permease [Gemmatimonadales bacterium]
MPDRAAQLKRRLRALFHGGAVDSELNEEIRLHLEMEAEELARTERVPLDEARRRAHIAFGGVERFREEHRDARGIGWLDRRGQDIRYAFRGLRNRPGFTLAVVLTLALGIGANAAMFSIVDRLLFRAPPLMHDADRAHRVFLETTWRWGIAENDYIPYARFSDLTRDTRSFERTALFTEEELAIGTGSDTKEMQVGVVSAGFFGFFNATPVLGRYYTAAEDAAPFGAPVVVLSYGYWATQYSSRRDVVGQHVQIGATRYTVIGVAPRGFFGMWPDKPPVAFVPAATVGAEKGAKVSNVGETWWSTYHWTWAEMMVQRKPNVTAAQASADLSQAFVRSYQHELATGSSNQPINIAHPRATARSVLSERGPHESDLAKVATWIGGVAMIVWLIACANVANLLLARALQRRREIAVRLALGVSRARLAAQLLTESIILALLGGVSGVIVAQVGGAVLRAEFLARTSTATVITDPRTLIYAGAAALIAGLLSGLAPLLQTRRVNLSRDLRAGMREGSYQKSPLRSALLILQGTLSVVLLVGAGLFVRSLSHVKAAPLGYAPEQVLMVERNMRGVSLDSVSGEALVNRLHAGATAIPGVTVASRQLTMPFWNSWSLGLYVAGIDSVDKLGEFSLDAVSPEYFATMGTRILRGRGITATDGAGAPLAMVVSQAMADKLWPHEDALGKCVRINSDSLPCNYVVGVAENIKSDQLGDDPGLYYYLSAEQFHPDKGGLFLKVNGDPDAMKEQVRKALQPLMPGASYLTVTPIRDIIGQQTQPWQLGASMFVVFGALALVLAAIGLYSVISFNVSQRFHELGVRIALGATMGDIASHVITGGLKLAGVGVALGIAAASGMSHWIEPLLFEESPHDPVIFVAVAAVLLIVAALASFIPARRAVGVDPVRALRMD